MAENQKKAMDKQQKTMIAMGVANSRDLSVWIGGVWSALTVGLLVNHKHVHRAVFVPYSILSVVLAYNIDFAYGNKAERIRKEFYKINALESHWYTKQEVDDKLHEEATTINK